MFPDKKKAALLILAQGKGDQPDDQPDDQIDSGPDDAVIAAEDLISAVQEKNPDSVVTAMRAIFDSFQAGDDEEPPPDEEEEPAAPPFARGGMVGKGKC